VDADVERRQVSGLREVRRSRDATRVAALLDRLAVAARDPSVNLVPVTIDLVKARASMGEITARLREVWGTYVERPVF
jgi:methylmalonyl-CoA mutase N-terminal domain/subunit